MPSPRHALPSWALTALTLALSALALPAPVATQQAGRIRSIGQHEGRPVVANEILVKFRQTNAIAARNFVEQQTDAAESAPVGRAGARRLRSRRFDTARLLALLRANPDVEYAEPNYMLSIGGWRQDWPTILRVPGDPSFATLWGLQNTGQTVGGQAGVAGADISAASAWGIGTGSRAAVVGVIDTGIAYAHPDLSANIWSAPSAFTVTIGGASITCAAGTHGFNAITNSCDPADDHGHGTHVAGTIGASGDNGVGVTGVNWTASLMALKFLNASGSGATSDAIEAIDFAIQAKARFGNAANVRVLSNSWGGGSFSQALLNEIALANGQDMLFVAAAGNDGLSNDTTPHYPASYTATNVVSVAATTNRDQLATFSNYGAASVHLGAPGASILSTYPGNTYATMSGTSMATPHVAGAAALLLSTCGFTTAALKSALLATVDPIGALAGRTTTGGRLNAYRALQLCAPPSAPSLTAPSGPGVSATPTFVWAASPAAEAYQLYVQSAAGPVVFQRWTPAATVCGASTCSWTPGPALDNGNYSFSVQARNAAGYSPWAAFTSFTVGAAAPARVTLTAPTGAITSTSPDFVWAASTTATRYQLYIQVNGGTVLYQRWLNADEVCRGATCSVASPVALSFGTTYAFSVQASNASGLAAWANFLTFTPTAATPAAPVLTAPTGAITTAAPAFVWTASATATRYQLYLQVNGGAVVFQRWLNATDICAGTTCSIATPASLAFGTTYAFSVQASNSAGLSPWASFLTFTPTAATPAVVTLTAPSGAIGSTTPAFTWNISATATRYQLYIQVNGGAVLYQRWLNAGDICGASSCSVAAPIDLQFGTTYAFSVQASNSAGLSPWAGFATFTPTAPTPAAATVTAPSGASTNPSPAFAWAAVAGATRYQLYVQVSGGAVLYQRWLAAADVCSGAACAVSSILTLAGGDYVAYVQTGNAAGNGPWSSARTFTVTVPTPGTPTLVAPTGQVANLTPTFIWNAASNATRYQLYVQVRGGAVIYQRWLEAADRCGGSACSIAAPVTLTAGTTYDFTVQAANASAYGPWAAALGFSTAPPPPAAPTPLSPTGTITEATPAYTFTAVPFATSYVLAVYRDDGNLMFSTAVSTSLCTQTVCTAPSGAPLTAGQGYYFFVQARGSSGDGPASARQAFRVSPGASIPAVPILNGPTPLSYSTNPTYQWNPVAGATSYVLLVRRATDAAVVVQRRFAAASICGLVGFEYCDGFPNVPLTLYANYTWTVQAENDNGASAFATPLPFRTTTLPLTAPAPTGPTGTIQTTRPALEWLITQGAATYDVQVLAADGVTVVYSGGVDASTCSVNPCSVSPVTITEGLTYLFRVRAVNQDWTSAWSDALSFRANISALDAPVLYGPSGVQATTTPQYAVGPVVGATRYQLYVESYSGSTVTLAFQRWFAASDVCPQSCLFRPDIPLEPGKNYRAYLQAGNAGTVSAWSAPALFSITASAAVPTAPVGTARGQLLLEWTRAAADVAYQVYVEREDGGGVVLQRWIPAENACGTNQCSAFQDVTLTTGARYRFYVQTRTTFGYSPWSAPISFLYLGPGTVEGPPR